jgi:uncharacterized protein (TIGR04255 family)
MTAVPINSANAVDAVAFVIIFDRNFTEQEEKKFLELQKTLADDLQQFSQDIVIETQLENGKAVKHESKNSGIKLQSIQPNGKVGWGLHIFANQISIFCGSYDRWEKVWAKVDKYLKCSVKLLELNSINVTAIALQYVDRFTENASDEYELTNVFNNKTQYLTSNTKNAGKLWHVHQGWFENISDKEKILHVLNLGATENSEKILTTIDHSLQFQFVDKPHIAKNFFGSKKEYQKAFDLMHQKNKDVLKELLNHEQCQEIGLV